MILLISTENNNRFSLLLGNEKKISQIKIIDKPFRQSELLLNEIKNIIGKNTLTGIIVVNGPGSFSGLRIGIATANALAYAWRVPIVGVKIKSAWMNENLKVYLEKIWRAGVKQLMKNIKLKFVLPQYGRQPNINI